MEIKPHRLKGIFEINLKRISDARGYFMRTYEKGLFAESGLQTDWLQENQSFSARLHTIRGLHFQKPPHTETKLIRVIQGTIFDVFVDLRKDSKTFGQWGSTNLSEDNNKMVYISRGFAHGFCTLTEDVIVQYKVDNKYLLESEGGIRWNDPTLRIEWNVENPFTSEKDANLPFFENFESPF